MKDLVIKAGTLRRELYIALCCLAVAYGCNIYAILHFNRPVVELVSTIGYVVVLALLLYLVLLLVRALVSLVLKLIAKLSAHRP